MIVFDLTCSAQHRFEGWFRSAEDFAAQQARGLVSCPHCGSSDVRRQPSAVHVAAGPVTAAVPASTEPTGAAAVHPLAMLKAVVDTMVRNSEDVGKRFAEEARRIHYHEAPVRAIRGQASADDCSALRDEGIDFVSLPLIEREDLN
jgi:hypothetical protein